MSFGQLFCVFKNSAHGMQFRWCVCVREAKFFTTKDTKAQRMHEESIGLGGKAGERQFTAEIAENAERGMGVNAKAGTGRPGQRRGGSRWIGFESGGDRRWDTGRSKGEGAVLSGERSRAPRPRPQPGGFRIASTRPYLRATQATCCSDTRPTNLTQRAGQDVTALRSRGCQKPTFRVAADRAALSGLDLTYKTRHLPPPERRRPLAAPTHAQLSGST